MRRSPLSLLLLAGLASSVCSIAGARQGAARNTDARPAVAAQSARDPDAIPLRVITLYRSGVGYFERQGRIAGDVHVSLRFEKEQINDILKSMVLLDLGGGKIGSVGYGSKEPLERRLGSFGVNIADNPSMADLMARLRGARVRLTTADGPIEGTVLGTEARTVAVQRREPGMNDAQPIGAVVSEWFINVVTGTGVKSVAVSRINGYEILDAKLAEELNLALAALAESRDERSARVDLSFTGAGERPVVLGYIHETPVWKTSYRLVLPDETAASGGGKPQVQGWAIVENTTDEDWRDVRLALASGQPVGFRMDLHEPLFVERPMLPVPSAAVARARMYESVDMPMAESARVSSSLRPAAAPARMDMAGGEGQMLNRAQDMERYAAEAMTKYSPQGGATASETGEQFRYEIASPVTIERQRSAMLPIMNEAIEGRRVSIYNGADSREHPMRGVEITNSSGFELSPGPIAVYDGAGYAGDAQIAFTSRAQQRLLSYAVDLDVRVLSEAKQTEDVVSVKIVSGLIETASVSRATASYTLTNRDGKRDRVVILEQPKKPGWKVVQPEKVSSESEALNRFEVALGKAEQKKTEVVEEKTNWSRIAMTSMDLPTLLGHAKNGKASGAVVDAIKKAAQMQAGINDTETKIRKANEERASIGTDQSRIRQNMQSIDRASDLYARYMKTMNEQETRIEQIGASVAELERQASAAKEELTKYLAGLNVG